jgi:Asp-tRNA(Asn)/Glu-tRNA(Gln) amidotransferase A subunit family amidase
MNEAGKLAGLSPLASGLSPLAALRAELRAGRMSPQDVAIEASRRAGVRTYLWRDEAALLRRAEDLAERLTDSAAWPVLYGVPVSLKDCFDLAGTVTSCGSRFYAERNPVAEADSWVARRLLDAGAMIVGKAHLHQLAYGITGENVEYGDSVQPRDRTLLTGGSSSGAVASVQEGSALAAVGTDTGGSIRVPAALCGLAGYRASLGLVPEEICWRGGGHLAVSFDTIGLVFRDLRDGPELGRGLFELPLASAPEGVRIGCVGEEFLHDCEAEVLATYADWQVRLAAQGATLKVFDTGFWAESVEVFAPIQAHEAARLHRGFYEQFEPPIAERLGWGASLSDEAIATLRERLAGFRARMAEVLERFDFLLWPCAPVSRLRVGEDHQGARGRILRYTAPASLAGLPVVTLPGEAIGASFGTGVQLAGRPGDDARLLRFSASAGEGASR